MARRTTAAVVLAAFMAAGCATKNPAVCKVASFLTGGALGAVGGGVGVDQIEPTPDNGERAAGAAAGFVAGGLIGALLGQLICQEEEAPPPPPPPPPAAAPPAKGTKIAHIPGPNFEFNKATLTREGESKIDEAVRTLEGNPSVHVAVEGHTDSVGSDAYNQKLSERRARTVADYLIDHGVSPSRLTVTGYGETKPVADNGTPAGRAENRRVEIVVD